MKKRFIDAAIHDTLVILFLLSTVKNTLTADKVLPNHHSDKRCKLLNLSQFFLGWDDYKLKKTNDINSDLSFTDETLYSKCDSTKNHRTVCFYVFRKLEKLTSYLDGEECLQFSSSSNKLELNSQNTYFNLYIPMPWRDSNVNIKRITPNSRTSLYCNNVPNGLITLSTTGLLHLSKQVLHLALKNIKCTISSYNKSVKLNIFFERDIQILLKRRRRNTALYFEEVFYSIDLKEDTPPNSKIVTMKVIGGSGKYIFTKSDDPKTNILFKIERDSGNVILLKELNRDDGSERFSIDIKATDANDRTLSSSTSVRIRVLDVNDNAPIFKKSSYSKVVDEEQSPNKYILTVGATDADDGINREILYSIIKGENSYVPFNIDAKSGAITNTEKLDRERKPFYVLTVKAEDQGEVKKSSTVLVNITLKDINDNPPKFSKSVYKFSILESTKVNTVVYKLSATDADIGLNGVIQFNQLASRRFRINITSGEIILNEAVDFDSYQRESKFTVVAFDKGSPPQYANAEVEITIEDVNDNAPKFARDVFETKPILEDTKIGVVVLKLSAQDIDSGSNGEITFKLQSRLAKDFPFALNSKNGEIKVIKPLDYETKESYRFDVEAVDNGVPQRMDKATVVLNIGNVNDNDPKFKQAVYNKELSEDTRKGDTIATVEAFDPDQLSVQDFEYSIEEGNSDDCFHIGLFQGNLVLKCNLDYKRKNKYELKLKVLDEDRKAGYAFFNIKVLDANNNAPKFDQDVYQWKVNENVDVGKIINVVRATDDDTGENARIIYSFLQGSPTDTFEIEPETGEIKTKKKLDRESRNSYTLRIRASDHGKPQKFGITTVVITVTDVNDNQPKFNKDKYTFSIAEDAKIGSVVGSVMASDEDEGLNREIRYHFKNGSHKYFSIHAESGVIRTIHALDRELIARYEFDILAVDQGLVRLNSSAAVVIEIEDVQDSNPVFDKKVYNFSIDENSRVEVGRVTATLADDDFKHLLTYTISKNPGYMFLIERELGIIKNRLELDYEKRNFYQIEVRVISESGREDRATVNIHVNDVNDHSPKLEDFYIFLNVLNGNYNPLFKVPAEDPDVTSKLHYNILEGNDYDFVSLSEKTGELLLKKSIINTAAEITIKFEVSDGKYDVAALGHISVSEVTDVMVKNSMFIVLDKVSRNDFLKASVLRRFKDALAGVFRCTAGRIMIMSIEILEQLVNEGDTPRLEIAIAVRAEKGDSFMSPVLLKNMLYLNESGFEDVLGYQMFSIDFWDDYLCGKEFCKKFQTCSIKLNNAKEGNTMTSKYVTFRGIHFNRKLNCPCQHDIPGVKCGFINMCYLDRCGRNGKCISTENGYACKCDPGYSGTYCQISMKESVCPGYSPLGLDEDPCGDNGQCQSKPTGGFTCKCPAGITDTPLCTLTTRYFPKGSFYALKGLTKKKSGFDISFEFRTFDANAVLLYNGRYSNRQDFISLEIVDGQVFFSVSFGKKKVVEQVTMVQSYTPGGVNDGQWKSVKIQLKDKVVGISLGEFCDITTASILNPQGKNKYCASSRKIVDEMKTLDLTSPMVIGGLPEMKRSFLSPVKDFVGCIRNLNIDFIEQDLSDSEWNYGSQAKCPVTTQKCSLNYCTNLTKGTCVDTLRGPKCNCKSHFYGEKCEKIGQVVKLNPDSELVLDTKETSGSMWKYSFDIKTTEKNGVILEETINDEIGQLIINNGYLEYVYKSKSLIKLLSLYVSNGEWNHVELFWSYNTLNIAALYKLHQISVQLSLTGSNMKLLQFGRDSKNGRKLLACIKGFTYSGNIVNLHSKSNKNVQNRCAETDRCTSLDCGNHGDCKIINGVAQCHCEDARYKGPQCIDLCSDNPCNSGRCKQTKSLTGYECVCPEGTTGDSCEVELNRKCDPNYYGKPGTGLCGPCECRTHENYNATCDANGRRENGSFPGKCFCNDGFYYSANEDTCKPCNCLKEGSLSSVCDKKTGQCVCLPNVIGLACDRCHGAWQEITKKCGEINNSCPRTYVDGIWWDRIPPGVTRRAPCPFNAVGNATRYCDPRKSWLPPDFFACTSQLFSFIKAMVQPMLNDKKLLTKDIVKSLSHKLEFAVSSPKLSSLPYSFYGNDIMIGYDALRLMIGFEGNQTGGDLVSSDDNAFVGNLLKSAGMLFQTSSHPFWQAIQTKFAGTAGLMKEMERFVDILSKNLEYMKRIRSKRSLTVNPYSQATTNIYFEIQPIIRGEAQSIDLPNNHHTWSGDYSVWAKPSVNIKVSNSIFKYHPELFGTKQINVGIVIYKTLGRLLPKLFDKNKREKGRPYELTVYSDVVTLTIPSVKKLHSYSAIEITYKNVSHFNETLEPLVCAFWNYSLSGTISGGWSPSGCKTKRIVNTSDIACTCNHLTSFALVGIKYTEVLPRIYQPHLLTYLSLIIAMVSLFCVFLIFLCLSQLKSNANSIHKNLALVLFLGWLVFIFAINRPDLGKSNCRIIAIVIHYCLTCAFSWLMVEALHMYRMILEPRDINYGQMMFYYFIGWGAPVIVVGVTAGLKPSGYGTNEFCWVSAKDMESIWTYVAPIMAIISGNIMMLILALSSSCEKANIKRKKAKLTRIRYRLGTSVIFLLIMAATVVSGLMAVAYDEIMFTYAFAGACVLEGIYMFLFYVLLNSKVRREFKNAYIRFTTDDKSYGLKPPKRRRHRFGEKEALIDDRYAHVFEAFNLDSTSSNESSGDTTDGRRRARKKFAGSDTTSEFPTTANDSSDSSDDDSTSGSRQKKLMMESDSDSSDDSSGVDDFSTPTTGNGNVPHGVEWKQATQKKLALSRTYASDGPMHSTPSESETSEKRRKPSNHTPSKIKSDLSAIQSESDAGPPSEKRPIRKGPKGPTRISSSNTDSDTQSQSKTPVSILKKKSQYDSNGHRLRAVRVKDTSSARKPLMSLNDTADFNDSQV